MASAPRGSFAAAGEPTADEAAGVSAAIDGADDAAAGAVPEGVVTGADVVTGAAGAGVALLPQAARSKAAPSARTRPRVGTRVILGSPSCDGLATAEIGREPSLPSRNQSWTHDGTRAHRQIDPADRAGLHSGLPRARTSHRVPSARTASEEHSPSGDRTQYPRRPTRRSLHRGPSRSLSGAHRPRIGRDDATAAGRPPLARWPCSS